MTGQAAPQGCSEASLRGSTQLMGWPSALQFRAEALVPARMAEMTRCIRERDFQAFGQLTMKDSNQFHATCLDTFPPISYLSDTSRRIIQLAHRFNAHHGRTKAGAGLGSPGGLHRTCFAGGCVSISLSLVAQPPCWKNSTPHS